LSIGKKGAPTRPKAAGLDNQIHRARVLEVRIHFPPAERVGRLDFQQELNAANINLPIVFLTGYGDIPMTVRAMKAGAVEFLTKPFREQDQLDAVQSALERDRVNRDDEKLLATLRQRFASLTPREQAILALVAVGRRNKQIAFEIGTSEVTVKVHRTNLMRKMQAASLADLITMATKLGIPEKSPAARGRTGDL
jgi:FixJ family two-component response regulator